MPNCDPFADHGRIDLFRPSLGREASVAIDSSLALLQIHRIARQVPVRDRGAPGVEIQSRLCVICEIQNTSTPSAMFNSSRNASTAPRRPLPSKSVVTIPASCRIFSVRHAERRRTKARTMSFRSSYDSVFACAPCPSMHRTHWGLAYADLSVIWIACCAVQLSVLSVQENTASRY